MESSILLPGFYAGLSGIQLPIPKYLYPPPFETSPRLTYYASLFNSIEINSSFYKLPRSVTVEKWLSQVPDNFAFTFKLWKQITHNPFLNFEPSDIKLFFDAIAPAHRKKGCILIQFPPSCGIENKIQLRHLLRCIKEANLHLWDIAIEFRNSSWYESEIFQLLDMHNTTLVIHDIPKSAPPLIDLSCDFVYIRFHGPTGNYRGSYANEFLSEYAMYVRDWLGDNKKMYIYFNNTIGDAYHNLRRLKQEIEIGKAKYSILPCLY
jgi:uncharacterized protein YecE (DUF72 family)